MNSLDLGSEGRLAEVIREVVAGRLGFLGVPSWQPPFLSAAGSISNMLLLLPGACVAAVHFQRKNTEGHIPCSHTVSKVPGGDPLLTSCSSLQGPGQHISENLLLYEEIEEVSHVRLGGGELHCPARAPPVGPPGAAHAAKDDEDIVDQRVED